MHINIQCLKNKCNELILFLRDNNNIDIITVNEHWLKPDELVYTHTRIDNFFIASSYCRPRTKHGGVLILLKKGIKSVPRQDINKLSKEVDCELCAIEIPSWIIVTVYRSPLGNFEDFITIFTAVCELWAKNKNKTVIITGDFNININKDNAKKNSFIDLLNSYALHLNVKGNTRVCSTSSSCIDNIITSIYNKVDVDVLNPHLSDHYAIFLDMQYIEKIKMDSVIWTRQMTTNNIKNFCENLDRVNSLYTAKEKFEWFFENFLKIFYQ
jgi:exonuclease III